MAQPKTRDTLGEFRELLSQCAALRCLIPISLEEQYFRFCAAHPDVAQHIPIAYHAFREGYLVRLTAPIHEFCLEGEQPHSQLIELYIKDLRETWILKPDAQKRFEHSRRLKGRLAELVFGMHLTRSGWRILELEAWGSGVDVKASRLDRTVVFEVKHLGVDQFNFELTRSALELGGVASGSIGVYSPIDYLLFRVYEGAVQLANEPQCKVVAVIIDDYAVNFEIPLEDGWIDWTAPKFLRREAAIEPFLQREYEKNPCLDEDIGVAIASLEEIWFLEHREPFQLWLKKKVCINSPV